MTTNKRGSGRADPSDEPLIKRLCTKAQAKQDAEKASAATPAIVNDDAAKHVDAEDKQTSDAPQKANDAQRKATDDVEDDEECEVDYEPTDKSEEEEADAPQRPRSAPQNMDVQSYYDAQQKKHGDQRVVEATPADAPIDTPAAAAPSEEKAAAPTEEGEVEEKVPPKPTQKLPLVVEIHNGEPDSDVEIIEPRTAGVLPRMPGPERWPFRHTRDNLLARAIVPPQEYYEYFAELKRRAKTTHRGAIHPIPVVLFDNETPEDYEQLLRMSINLSSDVTVQRSQRLNFAEGRARKYFGGVPPRAPRYASAIGSADSVADNQQSGPARPQVASTPAPTSLGRGDNRATAPNTRAPGDVAGDDQRSPRQESAGHPRYPPAQQGQYVGKSARQHQLSDPRYADLAHRVSVIEASDASTLSRLNSLESSVRTLQSEIHSMRSELRREIHSLRDLGRQSWTAMKARLAAATHGTHERRRRPRTRPPSPQPAHSPLYDDADCSSDFSP